MIAERLVPFPKFGVEMYVDSSRKSVHMSYDELRERVCIPLFTALGPDYRNCTPYTFRKSGIKWAGRCGADSADARAVSLHKCEENYMIYYGDGAREATKYADGKTIDPIRTMWVFHPCVWSNTI
jgi:hypothetical protein